MLANDLKTVRQILGLDLTIDGELKHSLKTPFNIERAVYTRARKWVYNERVKQQKSEKLAEVVRHDNVTWTRFACSDGQILRKSGFSASH